ncbi:hypothetical protein FC959_12555 [Clostridium botulinum]|nr:hypothetical protein [Clostridium botulinum]
MKKKEVCYWCGNLATSKEHVPPKCLFPEDKDVGGIIGRTFRNNLITVPSCDEHNMSKSNEDEYLMTCLSGRVGNNGVAYIHNATKVKRAIKRNPNLIKINDEDIVKLNGKEFPIQWITVDNYKLAHSFEAIARALYYYEKGNCFTGECKIISRILTHPDNEKWSSFVEHAIEVIEREQPHWGTELKGYNVDIFIYQFSPIDGFGCQTLALTFYKSTKVYVILSNMTQEEIEKFKPKFKFFNKVIFGDSIN